MTKIRIATTSLYVDDEYLLFDMLHPGIRVALSVVG